MIGLVGVFGVIVALFFFLLCLRTILPASMQKNFCVLCASVSLTWLGLLVLLDLGWFSDPVLLALLLGSSVLGIFYLVDASVPEQWKIFRLPFFLTLVLTAYTLVAGSAQLGPALLFVMILWTVFLFFFLYQSHLPALKPWMKRMLECCKRW